MTIRSASSPVGVRGGELLAQLAQVDVDVVILAAVRLAPDRPEQPAAGHEPTRLFEEDGEDLVLARPELDLPAGDPDLVGQRVELDRAVPDHAGLLGGRARGAPQRNPDPGMELGHPERLRDVVVGAAFERLDLGRLLAARRQDDDRGQGIATDARDDDQPVPIREPEVEQDDVRPARLPAPEGLGRVGRLDDPVVVQPQVPGDLVPRRLVVLDEEDGRARPRPRRGSCVALPAPTGRRCRRQVDVDRETAELARAGPTLSAHRLGQATDDGEADPGARP